MGWPVPIDRPFLAAKLGASHAVVRLSGGNPQGDLHHQRHRIDQQEVDEADPGLESGAESLQYPVRRLADVGLIEIPVTYNPEHPRCALQHQSFIGAR